MSETAKRTRDTDDIDPLYRRNAEAICECSSTRVGRFNCLIHGAENRRLRDGFVKTASEELPPVFGIIDCSVRIKDSQLIFHFSVHGGHTFEFTGTGEQYVAAIDKASQFIHGITVPEMKGITGYDPDAA